MATDPASKEIPLPRGWPASVRSAIVQVVSLAHLAIIQSRSWAANSRNARVRLQAKLEQSRNEISLLEEEIRVKDARWAVLNPHRRPYYRPTERLAILELKAARGWSTAQTARRFLVEPATITSWMQRADEEGKSTLVETPEPVNTFPAFVRYLVRRLKTLCPMVGKKRIAQTLARAGLHLGVTTVGRMLKEEEGGVPPAETGAAKEPEAKRVYKPVRSKYPNHVWLVDLTVVPTSAGFWVSWMPFAMPQAWPFCWWVACAVDHFSRSVVGLALFPKEPASIDIRRFLGRAMGRAGKGRSASPKYIVADKGRQFDCRGFRAWCSRKGIEPRYAATGHRGATSVIERFFRSVKEEWLRRGVVPLRRDSMRRHVSSYLTWHSEFRPHQGLGGRTPDDVFEGRRPANTKARWEPRRRWPTDSPCAEPQARPKRKQPARLALLVRFLEGSRHLPIVDLKRVA